MFSTIDVMVAQAHIDQLNELADTKHLVKATATERIPATPEFHASPQTRRGCGLFAYPDGRTRHYSHTSCSTNASVPGHAMLGGPGRGAMGSNRRRFPEDTARPASVAWSRCRWA